MDTTTLEEYRRRLRADCLVSRRDALFDLADALLTYPEARTLVELSEAPLFARRWASLYEALSGGRIDAAALRVLWVEHLPLPVGDGRLLLGIDTSPVHRPESHTSPDRTYVYAPNLPKGTGAPAYPGWSFSSIVALPEPVSGWAYALDVERVASDSTASITGSGQLEGLLPLLPVRPILAGDRHYATAAWVGRTGRLPCEQLLRAQANRVLYRGMPPRTGRRGRPAG